MPPTFAITPAKWLFSRRPEAMHRCCAMILRLRSNSQGTAWGFAQQSAKREFAICLPECWDPPINICLQAWSLQPDLAAAPVEKSPSPKSRVSKTQTDFRMFISVRLLGLFVINTTMWNINQFWKIVKLYHCESYFLRNGYADKKINLKSDVIPACYDFSVSAKILSIMKLAK